MYICVNNFIMDVVEELCDRFIKLDVNEFLFQILRQRDVVKFILELNTQDQLFDDHIDSLGKPLTFNRKSNGYSFLYQSIQGGYKIDGTPFKEGDPYTLKNSGEFYGSFYINFYDEFFSIDADKTLGGGKLLQNFGAEIIGLTEANTEKLENYLFPLVENELAKLI